MAVEKKCANRRWGGNGVGIYTYGVHWEQFHLSAVTDENKNKRNFKI